MSLRFIAFLLMVFLLTTSYSEEAEWISGELHFVDGTVKKGQIKIPQPTKSIRIGANKVALRASKSAKTYRFNDKEIDFINLKSKDGEQCKYVNILVDNKLALFKEVEVIGNLTIYARSMKVSYVSGVGIWFSSNYNEFYAQREDEENASELLIATRGFNYFQKNVKDYFSDCDAVISASEQVEEMEGVLPALLQYKNCI